MLKEGIVLGERYQIISRVGSGGMADVYKAKDQKLDRLVAVKVLKPEFREDTNFVAKFGKEAQAAAGLSHPNVVNVFDVGEDRGLYYIVMELVEGITLKAYITRKGKLSVKEATSIAIQVSLGLEAAHNRGIVHRDVKPQNIIISTDGKVKLSDFGIAKATNSNTITANVMGSVHYSSPEQVRGGASDARSDIYSLGITMYEMVTGRVPYDGDTTVAVAIKHLQEEMVPPSRYTPDIPYSMEQIILKCTQKNPDRRYQNMAQLIEDLKRSLLDPQGNFVNLSPLSAHAQTVQVTDSDRKQLNQTAQRQRYQEEDEEDEDYRQGSGDEEDEDDDAVSSKLEKAITIGGFLIGAVIVVILIIVIGNMTGLFNRNRTHDSSSNSAVTSSSSSQQVEVPDFLGSTLEEAQEEAERYNLTVEQAGTEASDEYEAGQILSQDPKEGTSVEEGSVVRVTVSSGPETVYANVPAGIVGASQSEAEQAIRAAGLVPQAQNASSDSVKIGYVISVDPGEGAQVEEGSSVTIVVSTGPEETPEPEVTVKIPDLIGWSQEEAIWALEDQGLNYTVVEGYDATLHIGDVIDMDPGVGEEVPEGTTVTLTINTEEASGEWVCQSNLVPPSGVDPDAIGYVTLTLSQAGYEDKVVYEGPNPWAGGEDYSGENITGQPGVTAGVITAELEDGTVYTYEVAFAPE
ncbi:MAG TPA: Stk1 family PASTA domain-containing Ser/Thr kinase [Candidatus Scatomonas merdigallinarum]|nr:Stk1 family PASTA domain-containing Ser/Thr kinase [Candidatus Scatomonas merdigallinarum]